MIKKCEWCGRLFDRRDDRHKFCSDACRRAKQHDALKKRSWYWYDITIKDLRLRDINNILIEQNITIQQFIADRENCVVKYLWGGRG